MTGTTTRLTLALAAALLPACATSYHPESFLYHEGYSEQRRAAGVYEVWFKGSVNTPDDRCEDLAVLRAAELCLAESKPFMRTSHFQTTTPANHWVRNSQRDLPMSALNVECLADKGGDAQDAAVVAATMRKRYKITAR